MASLQATSVAVADAVLEELRTTTRTLNPEYSRTYDNTRELKDSDVLHIDVVNTGRKLTAVSRGSCARDPIIQVIVRQRLGSATADREGDEENLDRLHLLVEEIEDYFFHRRLGQAEAVWMATETFGPSNEEYRVTRQFTAIINLTFRAHG